MPDDPDRDLLERFVRGDQDAFEVLFRRFEREVFGWILRIVRDSAAAEDALVDAFWRAYRGRARFDPARSFGAWLRRIASNAALDQLRRIRRGTTAPADGVPEPISASAPVADGLQDALRAAFDRLPPRLRVVTALVLIEGWSHAEVADALDLPVGTVKSRLFRATRALRAELRRQGIQP